jgi:hypothetical protein
MLVSARDKASIFEQPAEEAVKFVSEHYKCDEDSATAYVQYLQGDPSAEAKADEDAEKPEIVSVMSNVSDPDVFHTRYDPFLGEWVSVEPEEDKEA